MFGEAGHAYVFFTYGNHYCLNSTTENEGEAGAVLLRAVQPLRGIEEMQRRRGTDKLAELASGPGKLTRAMGISGSLNGEDLVTSNRLYVLTGTAQAEIAASPRIGLNVATETRWRYFIEDNPFVSHGRTHNYRTEGRVERGVVG